MPVLGISRLHSTMTRTKEHPLKNEMALGIPRTVLCQFEIIAHSCTGNFQARFNDDKRDEELEERDGFRDS
jgi:hypothetical protein